MINKPKDGAFFNERKKTWQIRMYGITICGNYKTPREASDAYINKMRQGKYADLFAGKTTEQCLKILNPLSGSEIPKTPKSAYNINQFLKGNSNE